MRLRFLVSGLAFFGVALLLAVLPVVAQGHNTPPTDLACTIEGTSGPDLLQGTSGADVICGFGGADTITAKGGNDLVKGGGGSDVIYGDTGRDTLVGGRGNDRLYARDSEHDHVDGRTGSDYARVDNPLDTLRSIESS
jgi:Ca2+-binding RTX toxin-like protein